MIARNLSLMLIVSLLASACNLRSAKTVVCTAEMEDSEVTYPVQIEIYEWYLVQLPDQWDYETTLTAELYENGDQITWHNSGTADSASFDIVLAAQTDDGPLVTHIMQCTFESQKLIEEEIYCSVRKSGLTAYVDCEPDICN